MLADFRLILGRFLPILADGWQMFGRFWLIFLEKIGLVTTFVGQKSVCEKTILEKKTVLENQCWKISVLEKPIL